MFVLYLIVFVLCITHKLVNSEGTCGDGWDLFRDDYYDICYKYVPGGSDDYNTVLHGCQKQLDSTLPTITSQSEQDFLNKMIVKYQMVDNVWLDAGVKDKHIVWTDKSSVLYENWMSGRPVDDNSCVEMITDKVNRGKWVDVPCTKRNAYVCKRVVMWSDARIDRLASNNRRLVDAALAKIAELKSYLANRDAKITMLEQNQVPVGFIYVQLPSQAEPKTLWPQYTWSDVTATYAGNFFRAEGNGSLAFGSGVQSDNAPRLSNVKFILHGSNQVPLNIKPGVWSEPIYSGQNGGEYSMALAFKLTEGEVRPRNEAVRLFKRVK